MSVDTNQPPALAVVDSLAVDVLTDNVSDTYVSKTTFAVSEFANVVLAGATEISGETLLAANLSYGLRLRSKVGTREHTMLFDTGTEGAIFIRNCRNLGLDLGTVEEIAITHGHWDHMGALPAAIDAIVARRGRSAVTVHVNPGMFNERGVLLKSGTIFPAARVPTPAQMEERGARVVNDGKARLLLDGHFYYSGEIPRVSARAAGRHMIPATLTAPRRAEKLPVTLVTGFLGSGKTTLVNHILSNRAGVRAAVLVNELGEIGIDNDLIVAADGGMVELSNGCICCSTNNDLIDCIVRVLSRPEPVDHILVETTGVADPLPVAQTFQRPEFRDALRLDAIVAVTDAEQFSLDLFDGHAVRSQLRHADAILVNKCDRVGEERLGAVEDKIRAVNAEARLMRTTRSAVPLPLILDVDLHRPESLSHGHHHAHLDEDGFVSLAFESNRPFSVARFQEFLDNRPPGLFRGKGFLWLAETGRRYVFHLVGGRFTLDEDSSAGGANRLVLIGRQLDTEDLRLRLAHCLASKD